MPVIRRRPGTEVKSTGDPAGQSFSPHGVATSAIDVLKKHGVQAKTVMSANRADQRDVAIQTIAGYMRRLTATGGGLPKQGATGSVHALHDTPW
jgi:hypothetical protein